MAGWVEGGLGVRPLLVACAAFVAGAFLGISLPWWVALLPLPLLFWTPSRAVALGLTFGLLRGAVQENPAPFTLEEEFEGRVISPDLVRVPQGLVALRLRGLPVYRGDRARFFGAVHAPPGQLNPGGPSLPPAASPWRAAPRSSRSWSAARASGVGSASCERDSPSARWPSAHPRRALRW